MAKIIGPNGTSIELTFPESDVDLIRSALYLFANDHEYRQRHGCADATRARSLAQDLEQYRHD